MNSKKAKNNNEKSQKTTVQVSSNSVVSNTKKKKSRKTLRKIRTRRKILVAFLASIILIASIILSFKLLFIVKTVEVIGGENYNHEEIFEFCNIELDSNIFATDIDLLQEELKSKYILFESISVKRKLPNKISIEVVDSVPTYFIKTENSNVKDDIEQDTSLQENQENEDEIINDNSNENLEENPQQEDTQDNTVEVPETTYTYHIYSQGFREIITQDSLPENLLELQVDLNDEELFTTLKEVLEILNTNNMHNITAIKIVSNNDIKLVYNNKLTIILGNKIDLDYKIKIAQNVIENKLNEDTSGELDCTQSGSAIYKP